ncbi:hypothetical protein, partial [Methyloterricola oryzae]|uniref:hypothetical protein n=1 Tax=Methyloterricola oryzae TaxID=1495050 RepID=UPI001300CB0B
PQGMTVTATPYTAPAALGASVDVDIANQGLLYGTYTKTNGSVSGRAVPLTLYNNYVRWIWVYVQYLKADGTNLSLNTSPTWPDTHYCQSVGLLPQIFTLLGVPLWDTNTINVTLNFPAEATSARLLFCGLGNDAVAGGWRQYFPADAYPDHIAPQDEVLFASITTGILTIGLAAFALLTDMNLAATWKATREYFPDYIDAETYDAILASNTALTSYEAFAATVAAGGATYEDITTNGAGNAQNMWGLLASLGSLIPKVFFGPKAYSVLFEKLAVTIFENETAARIMGAIPLVGQVFEVLQAVGDAATLAEAIGETASSPWIIENTISLTYAVSVTVSRDPDAAT